MTLNLRMSSERLKSWRETESRLVTGRLALKRVRPSMSKMIPSNKIRAITAKHMDLLLLFLLPLGLGPELSLSFLVSTSMAELFLQGPIDRDNIKKT